MKIGIHAGEFVGENKALSSQKSFTREKEQNKRPDMMCFMGREKRGRTDRSQRRREHQENQEEKESREKVCKMDEEREREREQ